MSSVKTILGTTEFQQRADIIESEEMVKVYVSLQKSHEKSEFELDTAFMYAGGKSEEFIGQMHCRLDKGVQIASKANPWEGNVLDAKGVRYQLETSLKRLNVDSIHLFYLHAPDHKTPITETLKIVNELYNENKFKEFGLSNYAAWQVAEIYTICKNNSWVLPTVYQGMYNFVTRNVEKELFKCLRYFNMRFYAYNPLAGGMLTGKHRIEDANKTEPGRFFGEGWAVKYRQRFWKKEIFDSIEKVQNVLSSVYGEHVSMTEASLRWLYHHSMLDGSCGDGVILGSANMKHLNDNLSFSEKGKLDDRVVEVMNECWKECCYSSADYFR